MSDPTAGPRLLDVPADWTMPKLGKKIVPPTGGVETAESVEIVTHYDTAAGDLAGAGASLVRGAGPDATWTLTVDGNSGEYPAVGRGIPVEIRDLLLGVRAGAALRASGRSRVERVTHRVRDEAGADLGTIGEVAYSDPDEKDAEHRRHLEVAGWDGPFLEVTLARLARSGAVERGPDDAPDDVADATVGSALLAYLRAQRRAVLRADLGLRRSDPADDTVHAFRVAIRRIRSALRVVDVADRERHAALDSELRWLSGTLGDVRDLQVLRDHLSASLTGLAPLTDVDLAPAERALADVLDTEEAAARVTLATTLSGRRYLALLRALREWCDAPPFGEAADEPETRLTRYVRAAAKDLDRRLAKAGGSATKLHGARKAAKRARYVAAFAGKATKAAGKHSGAIERRAKSLQTNLGDHQDCVLAGDFVRRAAAGVTGDAAFGLGVLWAHEQDRAATALRAAERAQRD